MEMKRKGKKKEYGKRMMDKEVKETNTKVETTLGTIR